MSLKSSENRLPSSEFLAAGVAKETLVFIGADGGDVLSIQAGKSDGDKLPTFTGTAYTGGAMWPMGYGTPVVIDLASLSIASEQLPILRGHDSDRIVGHANAEVSPQRIKVTNGVISGSGADASEVVGNARRGFRWQLSVGCGKGDSGELQFLDRGESVTVNGRKFTGPKYVARNYVLSEISFVPVGADTKTSAALSAAMFFEEGAIMKFSEWLKANGMDHNTLTPTQRKAWRAAFNADLLASGQTLVAEVDGEEDDITAGGDPGEEGGEDTTGGSEGSGTEEGTSAGRTRRKPQRVATIAGQAVHGGDGAAMDRETDVRLANYRQRMTSESQRMQEIQALGNAFRFPEANAIIATAMEEGWNLEKTELNLRKIQDLRASRPNAERPGQLGSSMQAKILASAMCLSVGIREEIACEGLTEQEGNIACGAEYRSYKLNDLMRETIEAAAGHGYGHRWQGGTASDGFIEAALRADQFLTGRDPSTGAIRAANFSTISVTGIVSNIAQKSLLDGYDVEGLVWGDICGVRNHPNFKPATSYRFEATGGFKKLASTGELQHIGVTESSFANSIDTQGAMIVLSRRMMIDDDLGAFSRLPAELGRMAALAIEEGVFVMFLSGLADVSNFLKTSGTNKNVLTGGGSALGISGLTAAKALFLKLVDGNNKPIMVKPEFILSGVTLEQTAHDLTHEDRLIESTANANAVFPNNPHKRMGLKSVVSPYIDNDTIKIQGAAITGQSTTKWWLLPPKSKSPVVVGFLNGQQQPTVRQADTDFATLGVQMSAHLDFGVGTEESFLVQNAGA